MFKRIFSTKNEGYKQGLSIQGLFWQVASCQEAVTTWKRKRVESLTSSTKIRGKLHLFYLAQADVSCKFGNFRFSSK